MTTWTSADAKRHFAQVLKGAGSAPQILLLRGKPVGVVVSYEAFAKSQKMQGEKDLSLWLADLVAINAREGELEIPPRRDREDAFGDVWL